MSDILIKGMEMPKPGQIVLVEIDENGDVFAAYDGGRTKLTQHKAVPVPPHGRLIDADVLRARMYHEAFETDTPMQKWDSGCWIRYKMFELMEETSPTIIPAEKEGKA